MKLGVMQPYFFPYVGYFDLIAATDRWVVFDTAQYARHSWMNRNRILHPRAGWQYIVAPVARHPRETAIRDVRVTPGRAWRHRVLGQLEHYRRQAPHWPEVMALVEECLAGEEESLARLNVAILDRVCRQLEIPFRYEFFSEMRLDIGKVDGPGGWAPAIAAALGADEYVNLPGGDAIFDPAEFERRGVRLTLLPFRPMQYACGRYPWQPALSIVDVLMWNAPSAVRGFLRRAA